MEILKKLIKKPELVRVYSHPRSGTHFLEAFIAQNFYRKKDLNIPNVKWGHWSNRKEKLEGNPYGKLFGNHYFANQNINTKPKIYIIRDARAVAYSVWKTNNFIHKDLDGISFSDFLRTKIDWKGSPSNAVEPDCNILEHWVLHTESWLKLAKSDTNLLVIHYEDLVDLPYEQYLKIHSRFFSRSKKLKEDKIDKVKKPLGLLPNKGTKDSWREVFGQEDEAYFFSIVPEKLHFRKV
ncbi:sulfotransferase domain-containing protein [Aequorivita marina]|uniref:sulfotransferase domain-containing protein n=1 Tax=Aequorivita marina TaxID=3073654 RepID=UPI002874694F|nr:sulfotransferase domain-containing protein [Aequorivita sp. S2608]MDS1298060.1 sulfotransferase domain-containing protein [Aequorivita sp. S2608]